MKIKAYLIIVLQLFGLQLCISTSANSAIPPNYIAYYDVEKYSILVGRSTINLHQTEDKIHYSQEVELVGLASLFKNDHVAEDSWITKTADNRYLLDRYQYTHTNSSRNRNVMIEGNWSQTKDDQVSGILRGTVSGNPVTVPTNKATWDNFSFQLALINDVSDNNKNLSYNVISRGRLREYTFSILDSEQLEINNKQYDTVKLERNDGKKTTRIWLAPELHYIPVLIETYKDDDLETKVIIDTAQFKGDIKTDE